MNLQFIKRILGRTLILRFKPTIKEYEIDFELTVLFENEVLT
ncbi:hypothetical protein PPOLYM_00830 [Paenibacillus polymyxa]|nr:hypothetical protein PPOLYM_00830 [Paenibacillus polymyxa]